MQCGKLYIFPVCSVAYLKEKSPPSICIEGGHKKENRVGARRYYFTVFSPLFLSI